MPVTTTTPTPSAPAARTTVRAVLGDLATLSKPGITRLVLFTTAAGYLMAAGMASDLVRLFHTLLGTGMATVSANALNMWWERDSDRHMDRTSARPLPAGRLPAPVVLALALLVGGLGLAHLAYWVNALTVLLVAASLASYVLVYTPLKRRTHHATLIGTIPGALPVLAGWAAAAVPLDAGVGALFAVLLFWQMPHFYALAWVYREDYARGGLRMLSVVDPSGWRVGLESTLYSLALLAASLIPVFTGTLGALYGAAAAVLGVAMVILSVRLWRGRSARTAWQLFFGSITYLPVLLVLMLLDRFLF